MKINRWNKDNDSAEKQTFVTVLRIERAKDEVLLDRRNER